MKYIENRCKHAEAAYLSSPKKLGISNKLKLHSEIGL